MSYDFDIVVIGGGPGGYVGAIRAAQLGKKVAIVEKRKTMGGTCLNVGCIPSKALLDSSEWYDAAKHSFSDHGIVVQDVAMDVSKMMQRKEQVVADVCNGVDFLIKKNKIKRFYGTASFLSEHEIQIAPQKDQEKVETISGENILIATGSEPISLPNITIDGKTILTSDHALALTEVPKHLVIIGAGVIGLELGSVWRRLGAKVTVVEMLPGLFPNADKQMSSLLARLLKNQGMDFLFGQKVTQIDQQGNGLRVLIEQADKDNAGQTSIDASHLLVAVGRKPFVQGLNHEKIGLAMTKQGRIQVNPQTYATSIPHIYAVGDVIDGPMLAHKASDEAIAWAEKLSGQAGHINYNAIPYIVYTWPEMAWVGESEEALRDQKIPYQTGKFFFRANGRARAMNESEGLVKILAHKETDRVLGMHIIGPRASDLIVEGALAIEFSASAEDLARTVHAHPTLAESVREAAMAAGGWSIHS